MTDKWDANEKSVFFLICSVILMIGLIVYDIYNWNSEAGKCTLNPYTYGVAKLSKANNADLICTCTFSDNSNRVITITKNNMTIRG